MEIWIVYSTFPNRQEALSAAQQLVEKRLAACVNLHDGVTSIYRWQGAIQQEKEVVFIAKTQQKKVSAAIDALKQLHSYEVPCIVAYPVGEGLPAFLQWVADET